MAEEQNGAILAAFPKEETMSPVRGDEPLLVEDLFPRLDISPHREFLKGFLREQLRLCMLNVSQFTAAWERWRRLYDLEELFDLYVDIGGRATFPSGLVFEKSSAGMDRLLKAVFAVKPMFLADDSSASVYPLDSVTRSEKWFDQYLRNILNIRDTLGRKGVYDFILDGSVIAEVDHLFKNVPVRDIEYVRSLEDLDELYDYMLDPTAFDKHRDEIETKGVARVVVERENIEQHGLSLQIVDKEDHLIPANIYEDKFIQFRSRRLYYTQSHLQTLASSAVNRYEKEDVDRILNTREMNLSIATRGEKPPILDELRSDSNIGLGFDWQGVYGEQAQKRKIPYKDVYIVHRVSMKWPYKTKADPKALVPKWVLMDYEFDSGTILRASVYPHLKERQIWVHGKLGFSRKSYYGFGFGAMLEHEDSRETSLLNLYQDGAANATFTPYITLSPEFGGLGVPFRTGMGPGQVGFVSHMSHFHQLDLKPPPEALLGTLLPISVRMAQNRVGLTGSTEGQAEVSDPRAPAAKTAMLLREAGITMDAIIDDFCTSFLQPLSRTIWSALREAVLIRGAEKFRGIYATDTDTVPEYGILENDLDMEIYWEAQASAAATNPETRRMEFMQKFAFFMPLVRTLMQIDPKRGVPLMLRWYQRAAIELELPAARYLLPTEEDMGALVQDQGAQEALMTQLDGILQQGGASQGAPRIVPQGSQQPRGERT